MRMYRVVNCTISAICLLKFFTLKCFIKIYMHIAFKVANLIGVKVGAKKCIV